MGFQVKQAKKTRARAKSVAKKAAQKKTAKANSASNSKSAGISDTKREKLILEHRENGRKLARSMLRRWRARMHPEEIDSVVDLTLCEAAKRYSPSHGASFMTFFFYHLRGHMVRAIATAMNANNMLLAFPGRQGVDIIEQTASTTNIFKSFIPECASMGFYGLGSPEHLLLRKEKIRLCREACKHLDELEQEVIIRSFGEEEPLVDIALSLGYSRCHISRVKKRALERLAIALGFERPEVSDSSPGSQLSARTAAAKRSQLGRRSRRRVVERRTVDFSFDKIQKSA